MPPHPPGQDRDREEHRQRTPGALRTRLHDDARALRTPDDWGACLSLVLPDAEDSDEGGTGDSDVGMC